MKMILLAFVFMGCAPHLVSCAGAESVVQAACEKKNSVQGNEEASLLQVNSGAHSDWWFFNSKKKLPKSKKKLPKYTALSPDPSVLTWLNKSNVHPGGYACGFMTVPLGTHADLADEYPDVKVYICMKFAETQPAPKGTLFGHCGGPGSLSSCGVNAASLAGPDYNWVGIDQRGLGRSHPTFATQNCSYPSDKDMFEDEHSEEELRAWLKIVRKRAYSCWKDKSFQLPAKKSPDMSFNFLQFSGTTQVAEDLNRFRKAIGADKLSIHVISYGTFIGATFASMFPEYVDKLVLNSVVPPIPDIEAIATGAAAGNQQQYDNVFNACNLLGDKCPIQGVGAAEAMRVVSDYARSLRFNTSIVGAEVIALVQKTGVATEELPSSQASIIATGAGQELDHEGIRKAIAGISPLYHAAVAKNATLFKELFSAAIHKALTPTAEQEALYKQLKAAEKAPAHPPPESGTPAPPPPIPTCGDEATEASGPVCQPDYDTLITGGNVAQTIIMSQSTFGNALNENFFVAHWKRVLELYPNSGLGMSVKWFRYWWGYTYSWPRSTPTTSLGSPDTKGIIVGFLYDPNTPYKWAQQMHEAFPHTSLLTSQASYHGLTPSTQADPKSIALNDCWNIVRSYFDSGSQPLNGELCRAPMPLAV